MRVWSLHRGFLAKVKEHLFQGFAIAESLSDFFADHIIAVMDWFVGDWAKFCDVDVTLFI